MWFQSKPIQKILAGAEIRTNVIIYRLRKGSLAIKIYPIDRKLGRVLVMEVGRGVYYNNAAGSGSIFRRSLTIQKCDGQPEIAFLVDGLICPVSEFNNL
jgi:hypothetical protein